MLDSIYADAVAFAAQPYVRETLIAGASLAGRSLLILAYRGLKWCFTPAEVSEIVKGILAHINAPSVRLSDIRDRVLSSDILIDWNGAELKKVCAHGGDQTDYLTASEKAVILKAAKARYAALKAARDARDEEARLKLVEEGRELLARKLAAPRLHDPKAGA